MIKTDVKLKIKYTELDVKEAVAKKLPIDISEMKDIRIVRRALNVSDKDSICYDTTVALSLSPEREAGLLKMRKKVSEYSEPQLFPITSRLTSRPIVVGAGPAGLFAALFLSLSGARPILIERGLSVDERISKVKLFSELGILDTECNVQFGEGGAGTYSDGKLKVGGMDKYKYFILSEFVSAGADPDIMFSTSAHLGTDKLSGIVKKIREKIIENGGEVHFSTRLTDLKIKDNRLVGIRAERNGEIIDLDTDVLIMATGHSARDTFELLLRCGARLTPRPFGIGVRIEHPREYINTLVYGKGYDSSLPTASYHLVTHLKNGRSVYSFCMCPGGTVVPAASERDGIVTNGMSEYLRDGDNSNAAFLVSVTPDDFSSDSPLSGIDFQRQIEKCAYRATGSYKAPSDTLSSLVGEGDMSPELCVKPSYPIGTERVVCDKYLPELITSSLRAAISYFDDWMGGFYYPGAAVTGPETRSTSPVRVLRDENCIALGISGLYPVGEGAGYSGGIVSSARDGLVAAESILQRKH